MRKRLRRHVNRKKLWIFEGGLIMKSFKLWMMILVIVLVVTMGFGACSNNNDATSNSDSNNSTQTNDSTDTETQDDSSTSNDTEPVNLTIWIAGTGDPQYDKSYRTVLDAYCEENTNVSYELTYIGWGEYFSKLNTGLIGGAGPDIFMLGYGQFGTVQDMDVLLPLNDYIPEDWDGYDDFNESMLKVGQKDGVQYAIFSPSTRVFLYRKDIAEEAGLTEDDMHISSIDDLFILAEKMTVYDDNDLVIVSGLEVDPDQEQTLFTYASMFTDQFNLWNDDKTAAFNTDAAYQAYQSLYDFSQKGHISFLDPASFSSGILLGSTAIALVPEINYSVANDAFPGNIGVIKNDMNTLLIGNFFVVNNDTEYKDIAAEVLIHMYSKESLEVFQEVANQYAGRKSLESAYVALNPDFANIVYAYERSYPYSYTLNPKYTAAVQKLRTRLDGIFQGEDVKESITIAEEEWNQIINE